MGRGALLTALAIILLSGAASGHPLAPAWLEVREAAGEVEIRFTRPLPAVAGEAPELALPAECEARGRSAAGGEAGSRVETLRLHCPGGLTGRTLEVASNVTWSDWLYVGPHEAIFDQKAVRNDGNERYESFVAGGIL